MEGGGGDRDRWFLGDASPDKPARKLAQKAPHTHGSMQNKTCTRGAVKDDKWSVSLGHKKSRPGWNERRAQERFGVQRGLKKKKNSLLQ